MVSYPCGYCGYEKSPEDNDATCICFTEWGCSGDPQANAAHIAASSPDVVQADIEEILRLRQEVARLNKESTKIMDVAICLAEMMDGKHELCPRDCDVLPSAIKCNQYTDFNGEADCDATKCWLHVALNYSADCQHNDEDMGDFHALYEAMLRKEVRKTVEEEKRHG